MRTLFLTLFFVAWLSYYSFIAVRYGIQGLAPSARRTILLLYILASVAALASPVLFVRWASSGWPSNVAMHVVHAFVGLFLGQIVMASVMFLGDLFVGGKTALLWMRDAWLAHPPTTSGNAVSRSAFVGQLAMLLGGTITGGLLYGVTRRYRYKVMKVTIPIEGLPKAFHGLRILHLTDIHAGSFDDSAAVAKGIDLAMAQQPDLVVFSGDLVNNRADEVLPYLDTFAKLSAPLGVYSILGNHDYGDYISWPTPEAKRENLHRLKAYQQQMGWRLLINEAVTLQKDGETITLAGVENWSGRAGFSRYGNLTKALSGTAVDQPVILLSHDPSHWEAEVVDAHPQIALTLSGHTHGMQFGIESRWLRWSPAQYFYKQWAGLYRWGRQSLYVNRGFGFLGYQGRLGIPPEIALLELVEAPQAT